ncbi:MAG: DEAD/DEAH box helicase [Spirochaetaceae bacterium]|jgi:DNA excision repair protein ERCC-3|nr:DEAD/DEAH box helicase [Spirochaetaceae bacterium]
MNQAPIPPLIVQGDQTLLLDVHSPLFQEAREELSPFAELEKSPEHMHTYRMSPLSLWNAASMGMKEQQLEDILNKYSRYAVPEVVLQYAQGILSRWGKIHLQPTEEENVLYLKVDDPYLHREISAHKRLKKYLTPSETGFFLDMLNRGSVKLEMIKLGYPVDDLVPLRDGDPLKVQLKEKLFNGRDFVIRDYQQDALNAFVGKGGPGTGFGTVVMPCGSGKTVVGIAVLAAQKTHTLIITPNVASLHQWRDEILEKTDLTVDDLGEYSGDNKTIRPVTLATYQVLVWRKNRLSDFPHFRVFHQANWGLIIYDEVHLLPAPVFKVTAEIQAMRRLGLTATLVREDGAEEDVFSLVGPKRYDIPWKQLEQKGWIAEAYCHEIRIELDDDEKLNYAVADRRKKYRLASENHRKFEITQALIEKHKDDLVLVIGQYIDQLNKIAKILNAPLITGKVSNKEREKIYSSFKKGEVPVIVVSKVANFAIDLPDASVAIQLSGSFGSRQEEAQRLGRILRPKKKNSHFYSLVSRFTVEEEYAQNRQKFLTEQGYKYHIEIWDQFREKL